MLDLSGARGRRFGGVGAAIPEPSTLVSVGRAPELARLLRLASPGNDPRVALVSGEAGTGKSLMARAIHMQSARAERPFAPGALADGCSACPLGIEPFFSC